MTGMGKEKIKQLREYSPKLCGLGPAGIGRENQTELEGKLDRSSEENQLELAGKTGQNLR